MLQELLTAADKKGVFFQKLKFLCDRDITNKICARVV